MQPVALSIVGARGCDFVLMDLVGALADKGILQTLPGHQGIITCVRFLSPDSFASADDKGVVRCWRYIEKQVRQIATSHKCR